MAGGGEGQRWCCSRRDTRGKRGYDGSGGAGVTEVGRGCDGVGVDAAEREVGAAEVGRGLGGGGEAVLDGDFAVEAGGGFGAGEEYALEVAGVGGGDFDGGVRFWFAAQGA